MVDEDDTIRKEAFDADDTWKFAPLASVAADEATVRRYYASLERTDSVGLGAVLGARWSQIPTGAPPHANDDVTTASQELVRLGLSSVAIDVLTIVASPPSYVVRAVVRATHRAASGRVLRVRFAVTDIHEIVDGRIARTWHLEDIGSGLSRALSDAI